MSGYRDREGNTFQNFFKTAGDFGSTLLNSGQEIIGNLWSAGKDGLEGLPETGWQGALRTVGLGTMNIVESAAGIVGNLVGKGAELAQSAFGSVTNAVTNRGGNDEQRYISRDVSYTTASASQTEDMTVETPAVPNVREPETRTIGA